MVLEIGNLTDKIFNYEEKMKEFETWRKKAYEEIQDLQQKSDMDGQEMAALRKQSDKDGQEMAALRKQFDKIGQEMAALRQQTEVDKKRSDAEIEEMRANYEAMAKMMERMNQSK